MSNSVRPRFEASDQGQGGHNIDTVLAFSANDPENPVNWSIVRTLPYTDPLPCDFDFNRVDLKLLFLSC
jgi:hypothetical protein